MYTKLKKIEKGFTIVEVLIVLAIAALILAIILIAVPALQRSSRNSNIYHDAQNIASGVQAFEGNNQGGVPTLFGNPTGSGVGTGNAANPGTTATDNYAYGSASVTFPANQTTVQTSDLVFITTGGTGVVFTHGAATPSATQINVGQIVVDLTASCGTQGSTNTTTTGSTRQVAVLYPIENSSTTGVVGCVQE
jgi:prepilin-type N-terminal cleavage/methylation domain-containing protein